MPLPWSRAMFLIAILQLPAGLVAQPASRPPPARLLDLAFDADGSHVVVLTGRADSCALEVWTTASVLEKTLALDGCPERVQRLADGIILLAPGTAAGPSAEPRPSWWFTGNSLEKADEAIVTARTRTDFITQRGNGLEWLRDGRTTRLAPNLQFLHILSNPARVLAVHPGKKPSVVMVSPSGETRVVAAGFGEVDSIAISPDEMQFAISARRAAGGFDIALGSLAGGKVRWIDSEPADEVAVSWAPRGSKITFLVKSFPGGVLRTVHVPTGYQLPVDLSGLYLSRLSWDPQAEQFALIDSSPSRSDRIEIMKYGGEKRRTLRPSEDSLPVEPEALPGLSHAVLIRPPTLRYNVRYPLVVWLSRSDPLAWSTIRSEVAREGKAGLAVVPEGVARADSKFWDALKDLPWVDKKRIIVISARAMSRTAAASLAKRFRGLTLFTPGADSGTPQEEALPNGGSLIRYGGRQSDDVESKAVRKVLDRVKGLLKANGDS